jgi:hypothetical protein
MQGKAAYIRPKVVGPFAGPYASRSYVHRFYTYSSVLTAIFAEWREYEGFSNDTKDFFCSSNFEAKFVLRFISIDLQI